MKIKPWTRWGVISRFSAKSPDGAREHITGDYSYMPAMFGTRKEAREYIEIRYGRYRTRPYLLATGWRMPVARKLRIEAL